MVRGFKNFLMRGSVIEAAVAFVVALAFSGLIQQFINFIINPLLAATMPGTSLGLGWLLRDGNDKTFVDIGGLIGALIYFVVFMAVVYATIVVPYRMIQRRRGVEAFAEPAPTKQCPACLSSDLPAAASKCRYCGTEQPATTTT